MPYFGIRMTEESGYRRQPMVANCKDIEDAYEQVKYLAESSKVEIKAIPIREDIAIAAFGEIPFGRVITCYNWGWREETDEIEVLNSE